MCTPLTVILHAVGAHGCLRPPKRSRCGAPRGRRRRVAHISPPPLLTHAALRAVVSQLDTSVKAGACFGVVEKASLLFHRSRSAYSQTTPNAFAAFVRLCAPPAAAPRSRHTFTMVEDQQHSPLDNVATEFTTYEDFLDSQISSTDLYYLEDEELARQLVELGYRGTGEVIGTYISHALCPGHQCTSARVHEQRLQCHAMNSHSAVTPCVHLSWCTDTECATKHLLKKQPVVLLFAVFFSRRYHRLLSGRNLMQRRRPWKMPVITKKHPQSKCWSEDAAKIGSYASPLVQCSGVAHRASSDQWRHGVFFHAHHLNRCHSPQQYRTPLLCWVQSAAWVCNCVRTLMCLPVLL